MVHYLKYNETVKLLKQLKSVLTEDARVFVGVSGLASPLGNGYPDRNKPITQRFSPLSLKNQEIRRHLMLKPVCLYTVEELVQLFESVGFRTVHARASAFGNVKGIFKL